jgi:hypothetical protein
MEPSTRFTIHYHWVAGSMPPPYHSEYDILLQDNLQGAVTYLPDYPSENTPVWNYPFEITEDDYNTLSEMIISLNIIHAEWEEPEDHTIGGSLEWLELSQGENRIRIPARLTNADEERAAPLYQAIRTLVPKSIWDELNRKNDQYITENE